MSKPSLDMFWKNTENQLLRDRTIALFDALCDGAKLDAKTFSVTDCKDLIMSHLRAIIVVAKEQSQSRERQRCLDWIHRMSEVYSIEHYADLDSRTPCHRNIVIPSGTLFELIQDIQSGREVPVQEPTQ